MYILYLYTLQDAPDLLCISVGGIYYRIIWLHYKAISEEHFVLQETIQRWNPGLFANSKPFCWQQPNYTVLSLLKCEEMCLKEKGVNLYPPPE